MDSKTKVKAKVVDYSKEPQVIPYEIVALDKDAAQSVKIEGIPTLRPHPNAKPEQNPKQNQQTSEVTFVWHLRGKTTKKNVVFARYAIKVSSKSNVGSHVSECEYGILLLLALDDAKRRGWTELHLRPRFYHGGMLCQFIRDKYAAQGELPTYNGRRDFPEYKDTDVPEWSAVDPDKFS